MKAFRAAFGAASLLAMSVTLASPAPGQGGASVTVNVTGRVTDAGTGGPLVAALVRIIELHRETRTHEDGTFSLGAVPAGRHRVTVHRLGYMPVIRDVDVALGLAPLELAMRPAPMQVAELVVTGTISERGQADAITATTVLSDARLERKLDGTLASTIAGTPGVAMASIGPATARPVLRGMSGDRVLILEDGQRTGDLSSSSMDHAVALDPLTAGRVEVVRGPMSLLYGSSALGGVVNLIRREVPMADVEHVHGTLTAQAASVNAGLALGGTIEAPLGRFAVRGEGTVRRAGDLRTPVGTMGNTDLLSYGGSVGASLVEDWGYAGLSYRYYDNGYGLPGGFVGGHPNGVDIAMRRHAVRGEADWHRHDAHWESVKATLTFTDYLHDEIEGSGEIATRFQQLMTTGEVVGRHGAAGAFANGAAGVRAQYRDITSAGALRTPSTADWSVALFVVEEFGSGPLRLQVGARYDLARFVPLEEASVSVGDTLIPATLRTFGAVSGSVGLLRRFENGVRIGGSVSRAYRTPDFNELYSDGPHLAAYSYDVGNPLLRRETGTGADLFVRVERPRFRAEAAAFVNRMDGYIFPRNVGELGRVGERWKFQYENEDALLRGAEGEIEWTLREHLVFEATASYVRGTISGDRDTIPGLNGEPDRVESPDLPLMPPLHGRVGLRHETPRWSFGGGVRAAASQERLGDFEEPTAAYATADAFVGLRLLLGGRLHSITLRAENLLDAEIRDHLSRTKLILPEAGRNVSLLYRVQF